MGVKIYGFGKILQNFWLYLICLTNDNSFFESRQGTKLVLNLIHLVNLNFVKCKRPIENKKKPARQTVQPKSGRIQPNKNNLKNKKKND